MKKCVKVLVSTMLALSMLFSLSACGQKPADSTGEDKIESLTTKDEANKSAEEAAGADPAPEDAEPAGEELEPAGRKAEDGEEIEYRKFSEMEYIRPDMDAFVAATENAVDVLTSDASYEEICEVLDAYQVECGHFNTMYAIAQIRSSMDMTDEFYSEELAWVEENSVLFGKAEDHMFYAAAANDFIPQLEEDYFWEGFAEEYADESESIYTDRYVDLQQQESALLEEYRDLIAAPTILFRGEERDAYELFEELYGLDYLMAVEKYYNKYNPKLTDVFIRLIKVRNQLADERGYETYEDMQYADSYERDYTPEEAEVLIQNVRDYILPVFDKINSTYSVYEDVDYFEVPENLLLEVMTGVSGKMGGDIEAALGFMKEYELYDVSVSTKKEDTSFETYIDDYESPFILSDCTGDSDDIMTLAHEFGHFCRDYVQYGGQSGIDVQEVFSQAMEYLSLYYMADDVLTEDEQYSLFLMKILDIYGSYLQAGYAEFEHRVYSMDPDKLTADIINDIWLEICDDYGMTEEGFEYLYRMMWIDVPHFFEYPFYVISYTVSNEAAMQIFELEQENSGAGLEKYKELLASDCDSFFEMIEENGLENPFSEERVKKSADFIEWIYENVL